MRGARTRATRASLVKVWGGLVSPNARTLVGPYLYTCVYIWAPFKRAARPLGFMCRSLERSSCPGVAVQESWVSVSGSCIQPSFEVWSAVWTYEHARFEGSTYTARKCWSSRTETG